MARAILRSLRHDFELTPDAPLQVARMSVNATAFRMEGRRCQLMKSLKVVPPLAPAAKIYSASAGYR